MSHARYSESETSRQCCHPCVQCVQCQLSCQRVLSHPHFLRLKNILLIRLVTIKLKNLLLFGAAASVGLGTWFSLAHDALIVLQEVAMKIFNEQQYGPPSRYLNYK